MPVDTNDPSLRSWVQVDATSDFPIQNLPFGIFKKEDLHPRVGVAIGNYILDLYELNSGNYFDALMLDSSLFLNHYLNDLIKTGKYKMEALRFAISLLLREGNEVLQSRADIYEKFLVPMEEAELLMPIKPGN